MTNPLRQALGAKWVQLPATLKAHYRDGRTRECGVLEVMFPRAMRPVWWLLSRFGALVDRPGGNIATTVLRHSVPEGQRWERRLRYPDGGECTFHSTWQHTAHGTIVDFVNPFLGLELAPDVVGEALHYRGVAFVLKVGAWCVALPRWLTPGQAFIVERSVDANHYAMDFRLVHPLFGLLFRYSGVFAVDGATPPGACAVATAAPDALPWPLAPQTTECANQNSPAGLDDERPGPTDRGR